MSIQNLINHELNQLEQLVADLKSKATGHSVEDVRTAIRTIETAVSNVRTVVNGIEAESVSDLDKLVDGLPGGEGNSSSSNAGGTTAPEGSESE